MNACWVTTLATLLLQATYCDGVEVKISTDPPGPHYPAAVWIRFSCRVYNSSRPESFSYHWKGSCNHTGQVQFTTDDPLWGAEGYTSVWVQSTPPFCQDYLECTATDHVGNSASTGILITNITGVGMSIPTHVLETISNNSAVIITHNRNATNILCHSGSRGTDAGIWIAPGGDIVPTSATDRSSSSLLVHPFANLSLVDPLVTRQEGVYTCVVSDETGEAQSLHIGIFQNSLLNASLMSMEFDIGPISTILNCVTSGLPPTTAIWNKDGVMISQNSSVQKLTHAPSTSYANILIVNTSGSETLHGVYGCNIYMDWTAADNSRSGRERVSGKFAIYNVGESAVLECQFAEDVIAVELLHGDEVLFSNTSHNAVIEFEVEELMHNKTYFCRGTGLNTLRLLYFTLIVQIPTNAVFIEIEEMGINRTSDLDMEHFSLRCCATKKVGGLSSDPTVAWYGPNGRISEGSFEAVVADTEVHGEKTCVMLQFMPSGANEYSCEATLESPAMKEPLMKTAIYRTGSITSQSTPPREACDISYLTNSFIITTSLLGSALLAVLVFLVLAGVLVAVFSCRKSRKKCDNSL